MNKNNSKFEDKLKSHSKVIIFYVLAPLPLVIARNMESESGMEMAGKFHQL